MILTYVRKTHESYSQYFHCSQIRLQFIFLTSKQERGPIKQFFFFAIYCSHIFKTLNHIFLYKIWHVSALRPFCCKSSLKSPNGLIIFNNSEFFFAKPRTETPVRKIGGEGIVRHWCMLLVRAQRQSFLCPIHVTMFLPHNINEMNFCEFCDGERTCRTLLISNY